MWFDPSKLARCRPANVAEVAGVATSGDSQPGDYGITAAESTGNESTAAIPITSEGSPEQSVAAVATVATRQRLTEHLSWEAEQSIRHWLAHIRETDTEVIDEVIQRCRTTESARAYFLRRALEISSSDDDRILCSSCSNLAAVRRCLAAARGELQGASPQYAPIPSNKRRCEAYRPSTGDTDQRTGAERWPGLAQMTAPQISR